MILLYTAQRELGQHRRTDRRRVVVELTHAGYFTRLERCEYVSRLDAASRTASRLACNQRRQIHC
jgi:hypothetical protein